jgi:hypothetical protein
MTVRTRKTIHKANRRISMPNLRRVNGPSVRSSHAGGKPFTWPAKNRATFPLDATLASRRAGNETFTPRRPSSPIYQPTGGCDP